MPDDEEYVIPEGGSVPWRNLRRDERHRPPERDITITGVETMALAGNFTWGIVKVETDSPHYGLGETFIGEDALDIVRRYESLVVGENPLDTRRVMEHLDQERTDPGSIGQAAFAGIEIALLDIKGKILDVPVYELLGGKFRDSVRIYCDAHAGESLGAAPDSDPREVYTPESYAAAAREVVDAGFDALKFDLDVPTHRDRDTAARRLDNDSIAHKVSLVEAVREEIGYDVDLGMDLHWSYTVETAVSLGRRLEAFDLAFLEDPVHPEKTEAGARVKRAVDIPILTGENLTSAAGFRDALAADVVDIAAPDVAMCGGLGELRRIAAFCDAYGVPLAPHNLGSPVATVAGAHLGASIPNFYSLEFRGGDAPWWESLVERTGEAGPVVSDGSLDVPEGPGLGIALTDEAREYVVDEWGFVL